MEDRKAREFTKKSDGGLYFHNLLYVPSVGSILDEIMKEAHNQVFAMHPDATKMF